MHNTRSIIYVFNTLIKSQKCCLLICVINSKEKKKIVKFLSVRNCVHLAYFVFCLNMCSILRYFIKNIAIFNIAIRISLHHHWRWFIVFVFVSLFLFLFFIVKLEKVIRWTISKIFIIFFSLCFDQLNWSIYCADCLKCDSIVPLVDGEIRGFFGEIFFWVGCKRLRSFRKSGRKN